MTDAMDESPALPGCLSRRELLSIATGAALGTIASPYAAAQSRPARAARPNFLFLLTDDQRADSLSCAGHALLKTPNIDGLAGGGVRFTNAFVTTSICYASRASYVTGRYDRGHGVGGFGASLPPDVLAESFPARLAQAGYRTGCLGKWGFGTAGTQDVFDEWFAWAGQGSFFHNVNGQRVHNAELLARKAEQFLAACRPDQPFCLAVLYKAPHEPFQPDPRCAELFAGDEIVPAKTCTQAHFEALPAFLRDLEGRRRLMKRHPTPQAFQAFAKQYLRCVASVDLSVGKVLQALRRLKLADNTFVVFASDNGFFLGEHGLSGKWLMHEESIRVPMIVSYPHLPKAMHGRCVDGLVLNIDVAPTLLDFAGVGVPAGVDGRSLRGLLTGRQDGWRTDFFYEHHFPHRYIPPSEGVRTGRWKYIRYVTQQPVYEELYDLEKDPREERNLATDPGHARQLDAMRALHQQYVKRLGPARQRPPAERRRPTTRRARR